ncbi:SET domain-containing protein [Paenibacillus piri]|uniref:SET domain-containing protein-lysine N-methyltransferase n=1 Tax=Paenibacillus piri TaxID=2547395 RepID=A0A4R5KBZ8_9BACL|nr:SET domain-containing protein [Paenibacillus piri]TDF92723.1 SET domain-containing protein-lysine N-methyltransferase [Paenibacillus piri]
MKKRTYDETTWYDPRLAILQSTIQGKGMFASEPIRKGEIICIIGGTVFNDDEFQAYIKTVSRWNAVQIGEDTHLVDLSVPPEEMDGSMNHCCNSNTWMLDEVTVEARRDIAEGEEVTIDYALQTGGSDWYMECHCGSPLCRNIVSGDDWKKSDVQEQYMGHFAPFINGRIRKLKGD